MQQLTEQERREEYVGELKELLSNMEKRKFRLDRLKHFTENVPQNFSVDTELWKQYASFWMEHTHLHRYRVTDCMVLASIEVDIRVKKCYIPLLRELFLRVEDVDEAMDYFIHQEHFTQGQGGVPVLHKLYMVSGQA